MWGMSGGFQCYSPNVNPLLWLYIVTIMTNFSHFYLYSIALHIVILPYINIYLLSTLPLLLSKLPSPIVTKRLFCDYIFLDCLFQAVYRLFPCPALPAFTLLHSYIMPFYLLPNGKIDDPGGTLWKFAGEFPLTKITPSTWPLKSPSLP